MHFWSVLTNGRRTSERSWTNSFAVNAATSCKGPPMKDRNEALRAIPLFRDLPEKDLADIAGLLIDRKFPKEAVIYEDGSIGDYMYIIQEGQVKVTKMSEDGREKIL